MRMRTDAANAWLAKALVVGSPTFVSEQAGQARRRLLGVTVDDLLTMLGRQALSFLYREKCGEVL